MSLLGRISGPADLTGLSGAALDGLAREIRAFLIEKVASAGGHLGSNLGVVELTIAAHRVFHSPHDVLLFDTGHQAYVHKILTGRRADGPDGPSHHGMWDAAILPVVPGLRLAAPRDCQQLRELLREAVQVTNGPTVIRYPKATAGPDIPAVGRVGHGDILRDDPAAVGLLIGVGALAGPCRAAADELATHGVPVTVVDPRWIAPVDTALLKRLASTHRGKATAKESW